MASLSMGMPTWKLRDCKDARLSNASKWNISFEEEELRRLRLCYRPSPRLAPFSRIIMARDLTKSLRAKALQHEQAD